MKTLIAAAAMLIGTLATAKADDFTINLTPGFAGNVGIMSDYIHRGDSQPFGQRFLIKLAGNSQIGYVNPTITGGVQYTFQNGLFVSYSAITSDETSVSKPDGSSTQSSIFEHDVMIGWKTKLDDHWLYQTDVLFTAYPGVSQWAGFYSTEEFQNIVNYMTSWGKLVAAFAIEPQGQYHSGFYTYASVGADYNVPFHVFDGDAIVAGARVGYTTQANHSVAPNYWDWTLTVTENFNDHVGTYVQYTNSTNYYGNIYNTGNGQKIVVGLNFSF